METIEGKEVISLTQKEIQRTFAIIRQLSDTVRETKEIINYWRKESNNMGTTPERRNRILFETMRAIAGIHEELRRGVMNADAIGDVIIAVRVATAKLQDVSDGIWEELLTPEESEKGGEI